MFPKPRIDHKKGQALISIVVLSIGRHDKERYFIKEKKYYLRKITLMKDII
jgi:hypothetical protein